jgi:hypothetical protein
MNTEPSIGQAVTVKTGKWRGCILTYVQPVKAGHLVMNSNSIGGTIVVPDVEFYSDSTTLSVERAKDFLK